MENDLSNDITVFPDAQVASKRSREEYELDNGAKSDTLQPPPPKRARTSSSTSPTTTTATYPPSIIPSAIPSSIPLSPFPLQSDEHKIQEESIPQNTSFQSEAKAKLSQMKGKFLNAAFTKFSYHTDGSGPIHNQGKRQTFYMQLLQIGFSPFSPKNQLPSPVPSTTFHTFHLRTVQRSLINKHSQNQIENPILSYARAKCNNDFFRHPSAPIIRMDMYKWVPIHENNARRIQTKR